MASQHSQAALDLMAQLQDPHWALEAAQIEDEANGDIGGGARTRDSIGAVHIEATQS